MATNSETIWVALFDRLAAQTTTFRGYARRKTQWVPEQQPALELHDGDEEPVDEHNGLPPGWKLTGQIAIFARTGTEDTDTSPTTPLNDAVHEVREALEWSATADADVSGAAYPGRGHLQHWTNLGGRIRSLSVGRVDKGEGAGAGQAMATMEISIEVGPETA
jgi:hypothetical protein